MTRVVVARDSLLVMNHPALRAPLRRGELVTFPLRAEFPSIGGVARSAGVVRECRIGYLVPCHSREGGNRAWVVINYLIGGIIQRYIFYSLAIRSTNLIDPIPALSTPQIHSYLRGPRARE